MARPPKYVLGDDGEPVEGLSAQPWKGKWLRYYATFSTPRRWFGFDRDKAIAAYREWMDQGEPKVEPHSDRQTDCRSLLPPDFDFDAVLVTESQAALAAPCPSSVFPWLHLPPHHNSLIGL